MFDPTTCLQPLSNRYSHVPSQQTLYCYVTIARCSAPASMHARLYSTVILFILGLAITLLYILIVDDMIIINVDYIRRRMEGLGYPAPMLCSIRVT